MLDFFDVEQNTDEWFSLRAGKITSSKLGLIMANHGKAFGEPAKRYAKQIALEKITGKPTLGGFNNEHTDRGHEDEPIARMAYESSLFCDVSNGGFFSNDRLGCSPDGLVDDEGLIEIKSQLAHIHYDCVSKGSYSTAYKWQLLGNLYFTSRKWIDFISYCSSFPEGKRLYIKRMFKVDHHKEFVMIKERVNEFIFLIDNYEKNIEDKKYINISKASGE